MSKMARQIDINYTIPYNCKAKTTLSSSSKRIKAPECPWSYYEQKASGNSYLIETKMEPPVVTPHKPSVAAAVTQLTPKSLKREAHFSTDNPTTKKSCKGSAATKKCPSLKSCKPPMQPLVGLLPDSMESRK